MATSVGWWRLAGRTAIGGSRFGVGGLVDRMVGIFGASKVYVELQRHLLREEESDNQTLRELASAFHVPVIATNGVRFAEPADRPLYDVLTCIRHKTTLERAGTASDLECRALPEAGRGHGAAVRRHPRSDGRDTRAGGSPRVHDGGSRLPLSRVSRPRRRDDAVVSAEDDAGRRASSATGRFTIGLARRSRASSISSRSSISPATS